MKSMTFVVAIAGLMTFAQSAHARDHHHRHVQHHGYRHIVAGSMPAAPRFGGLANGGFAWDSAATSGIFAFAAVGNPSSGTPTAYRGRGRPAAWCGWEMRHLVGADPGPSFNLARNWARWGRPGPAGVGAVVVWAHHVGKIVGQENGQWLIESGNDGHAVRTRPRSIAGAIAIRWG